MHKYDYFITDFPSLALMNIQLSGSENNLLSQGQKYMVKKKGL